MTTGTPAAIGALGTVHLKGAEARRTTRQVLCSCHMRATWTRAVANSTKLTRCCTVRKVVTLVKCTQPTPATSAGVPTRKTAPSITSRCIKEERAERAGYAKECGDHVLPFFFNASCRSVDAFQRKKNHIEQNSQQRIQPHRGPRCKLDARDGCWKEKFKGWQKVEEHHEKLREGHVPVHCGHDEVAQARAREGDTSIASWCSRPRTTW